MQMGRGTVSVNRIIYSSKSNIHPLRGKDILSDILRVARQRNHDAGISGALVLHKDRFAQIVEGPTEETKQLFAKIIQDDRHSEIEVFEEKEYDSRVFSDWTMALVGVDPDADIQLFATKSALVQGAPQTLADTQAALIDTLRDLVVQ